MSKDAKRRSSQWRKEHKALVNEYNRAYREWWAGRGKKPIMVNKKVVLIDEKKKPLPPVNPEDKINWDEPTDINLSTPLVIPDPFWLET